MMISTEPVWVSKDDELAALCANLSQQAAIAVDTEFMRTDTFYPIAGLIQIGDGTKAYLIDPLAIVDVTPLRDLMLNEKVVKVLHACSEDIEVFERFLGDVPSPIFDTQIAAAFAGFGFSLGYASLVKTVLNVEIPKDETRSDWLQRPLSASQLTYAALDVAHMLVVYGKLLQLLKASERLHWVKSDCADLVINARRSVNFSEAFQKVGFAWKLRPQELAVLRDLCIWRESEARASNIPRNRLIKENSLFEIARKQPQDATHLQRIEDIPSRTLRSHTDTLLDIVRNARASHASTWPIRLDPPLAPNEVPLLKVLKNYVRDIAEKLMLPPELLIRKKEYEAIVRSGMNTGIYSLPMRLLGWRFDIIGKGLLQLAEHNAPRAELSDAPHTPTITKI